MANLDEIVEALSELTVLEASSLSKLLEEKWGVSASVAMPAAVMADAGGSGAEAVAEQTEFTVVLKEIGASKISVIKEVRVITDKGLKDAKELVDTPSAEIKTAVSKTEAEEIKKKLEAVGAVVELK
jgi:large subunit ribosomal protein L7/L12